MKTTLAIRIILLMISISFFLASCSGKKESSNEMNTWEAMDAYHFIMAECYHPLKDSANLAPARSNAELLATEADKWAASVFPARMDNEEMKSLIESLRANSRSFADQVKSGTPDSVLAASLTSLHSEYHHIMEAWEGGHEEHH